MNTPFLTLLKACAQKKDLYKGSTVHAEIQKRGLLEKNPFIASNLVSMYAKCGALSKAQQVLDKLLVRDVVTWSALISGYACHGHGVEALDCFEQMQHEGQSPNAVTFACILKACGSIGAADKGKKIHDEIARQGFLGKNIVVGTALVDMYAKCGALAQARQVLDELPARNVVSWSALIAGYVQEGQGKEALYCFEEMQFEGLYPNALTFACILKACGSIGAADKGKEIYDEIVFRGLLQKNIVLGNSLVDMYVKCNAFTMAQQVLNELPVRDVISWSALISGYAEYGHGEEALDCFGRMQHEGLSPTAVTFIGILKACGSIGAYAKGKQIHGEIVSQGLLGDNIVLGTAVVDMYAKCGNLSEAHHILDELPVRNVVSWSALITGYAQQGQGEEALNCFEKMQCEGLPPNGVTLTCMLNAFGRSGLVDEGQLCLVVMSKKYGITLGMEHLTCIVDLFGRAGHFDKAIALIKNMPSTDHPPLWSALLGACLKWGNVKLGKWAFEHAVQVDKNGFEDFS